MADSKVVAELGVAPPKPPETATPPADAKPPTPRPPRARTTADADRAAVFPPAPAPEGVLVAGVDESTVRSMLRSGSGMLGALIGDDDVPRHWRFTEDELNELVPPLTRYINRTPRLLVAAAHGDELTILLTVAQWTGRNVADARNARDAREAQRERDGEAGSAAPSSGGVDGRDGPRLRDSREDVHGAGRPAAGRPS